MYKEIIIIKKVIIANSDISKTRINKINNKKKFNYKIEFNFMHKIPPTLEKNSLIFNNLLNIEKEELEIINSNIKPINKICYITKVKYDLFKLPLIHKVEYISKIKKSKKENILKNCNNISFNEKNMIKSKIINGYNFSEEQNEDFLNIKNNGKKICKKDYNNNWNEFILYLKQKIIKNVEQFIFYLIKNDEKFKCEKNIFYTLIKRIINIYNNLLKNNNNNIELFDVIKLINSNLLKNIEYFNKYNYISFIQKKAEDNLINIQLFSNDDYLIYFILIIIKIEHGNFAQINAKNTLYELFRKYKLNNRNIYTTIRYADLLYEKMIKNKNINKSDEQHINHIKIKSLNLHHIYIKNIIYNTINNNLFSFSYYKHPHFHIKFNSSEIFTNLNNNILLNNNKNNINNKTKKNNKKIYYSITKINRIKHNSNSSGEIDIFENMNKKKNRKIINRIYDDYCFDTNDKINLFEYEENENLNKEKIRQISLLSLLSNESEIINGIDYHEEDIIFNQIKEYFN